MIDKTLVEKRFGSAASHYDSHAHLQKRIGMTMLEQIQNRLQRKNPPSRILEIGCGTGWLTEKLAHLFPESKILAIDLSEGMISHARGFVKGKNVTFLQADAESWELQEPMDLIVSTSTFQWFLQPYRAVEKYCRSLNKQGLFFLSAFGSRTFHEIESFLRCRLHLPANSVILGSAQFMEKPTLEITLKKTGLPFAIRSEEILFAYESPRHFFSSLRSIGANSSSPAKIRENVPRMKSILTHLNDYCALSGAMPVTYEILSAIIEGEKG